MDRISKLPDEVLQYILSFLPTKHAVATSILSTRWIHLWDSLQVLDFDNSDYLFPEGKFHEDSDLFFDFVDKVLSANKSPTIFKFKLRIQGSCEHHLWPCKKHFSKINGWIQNVVLRNVVEIDLFVFIEDPYDNEESLRIPGCSSLEIVTIDCNRSLDMPTSGCFPNLRVLDFNVQLDEIMDMLSRELILSLPRLEELYLCGDLNYCLWDIQFNVIGTALKVLDFEFHSDCFNTCDIKVMIDAPNLQVLHIKEMFLSSYLMKNKLSLNEIKIDIGEYSLQYIERMKVVSDSHVDCLRKLLQGINNAESLSISATTPLSLIFARDITLPVFHYFTKLEVIVYTRTWVLLLHWLQSFPNLKHLFLIIKEPKRFCLQELVNRSLSKRVPPCLSSSITEIEIETVGDVEEDGLPMYLLDNAKVLDKFIVNSQIRIKDGVPQ